MVFQGTAIPNFIIEVAGIMICLFALITIWYGSPRYTTTKRFMTAAFSSMLAYNLCLLFLEFSQAAAGNRWRTGVILVAFGTYLFPLIAAYIVSPVCRCHRRREQAGVSMAFQSSHYFGGNGDHCADCGATDGKSIEMCEQVKSFVQHGVWHIPDCELPVNFTPK